MGIGQDFNLHLLEHHRFSCNDCGKCCTRPWAVAVSPSEAESLNQLHTVQQLQKEGYTPLPLAKERWETARAEDGSCCFYRDSGCDIHREAGGDSKPATCQLFPFGLVNTPDGIFVSSSFACPAVLVGSGEALRQHREPLKKLLSSSAHLHQEFLQDVQVTENRRVPWDTYLQVESQMLASPLSLHPVAQLVAWATWLLGQQENEELKPLELEHILSSLSFQETLNILPLFVSNIIGVLEYPENPESRQDFAVALCEGQRPESQLITGASLPPFTLCEVPDLVTQSVLQRYLENQLFGKRLLTGPTVTARLLLLACALSIQLYYLDVRLQSREGSVEFSDLDWAFELIESSLVSHASDLNELFLEYERTAKAYRDLERSEAP